jgi:hypothetical protein
MKCLAWRGELDDNLNPIDKRGRLHLPGHRTCGHKDCVNPNHIIPDIELERIDISYRTKIQTRFEDLAKELS